MLFPYWQALEMRNRLYDRRDAHGRSVRFGIPVVSVGNITVGGTGKTPHTEMLVRAFKDSYKVAVISRGYKRKTKGYRIVNESDDFILTGDEPLQIKRKFPEITVAVCKNRIKAIKRVIEDYGVNFVILDDAFQYRRIRPSCSILLVKYSNTIAGDNLIPIGSLRDLPSQTGRADIVIITKSPDFGDYDGGEDLGRALDGVTNEETKWRNELSLREEQKVYFSVVRYCDPKPLFPEEAENRYLYSKFASFFSGIANDADFKMQLVGRYRIEESIKFSDHKKFTEADVRRIAAMAARNPASIIYTTEKDAVRLFRRNDLPKELRHRIFYIPIVTEIIPPVKSAEFFKAAVL